MLNRLHLRNGLLKLISYQSFLKDNSLNLFIALGDTTVANFFRIKLPIFLIHPQGVNFSLAFCH